MAGFSRNIPGSTCTWTCLIPAPHGGPRTRSTARVTLISFFALLDLHPVRGGGGTGLEGAREGRRGGRGMLLQRDERGEGEGESSSSNNSTKKQRRQKHSGVEQACRAWGCQKREARWPSHREAQNGAAVAQGVGARRRKHSRVPVVGVSIARITLKRGAILATGKTQHNGEGVRVA